MLVPCAAGTPLLQRTIHVSCAEIHYLTDSIDEELAADEILLARDVLDTQIVDIADQRLARVADVLLTPRGAGVEIVGVEPVSARYSGGWVSGGSRNDCPQMRSHGQIYTSPPTAGTVCNWPRRDPPPIC